MSEYSYTVVITPEEDGGFTVDVPALPGCHTEGKTMEEALDMAKDAIQCYIESLIKDNQPIPQEKQPATIATVKVVA
jgi:antitoxin HicB